MTFCPARFVPYRLPWRTVPAYPGRGCSAASFWRFKLLVKSKSTIYNKSPSAKSRMASLGHYSSRPIPSPCVSQFTYLQLEGSGRAVCTKNCVVCAPLLTSHRSFSDTFCASANVPFRFSRVTVPLESFTKFYHNLPGHSYLYCWWWRTRPSFSLSVYMKYGRNFFCDSLKGVVTST
jgi:hypothetical protein